MTSVTSDHIEDELRKWHAARAKKRATEHRNEWRTVRVNGQEVVVVTKPKRTPE